MAPLVHVAHGSSTFDLDCHVLYVRTDVQRHHLPTPFHTTLPRHETPHDSTELCSNMIHHFVHPRGPSDSINSMHIHPAVLEASTLLFHIRGLTRRRCRLSEECIQCDCGGGHDAAWQGKWVCGLVTGGLVLCELVWGGRS